MYRLTAALLIGGGTLGLTLLSPAAGILALMAYLPLMAELRRVLLYVEPWTGQDALVLVPAAAAGFLYVLSLPKARRIPPTRLNTLMVSLLVVMILQIGNPLQGPLAVGIAGALFYIVPLLWFWIGRSLVSPALLWRVLAGVVVPISIAAGVYGVYQNVAGLPWHQAQWIESGGYTALHGLSGSIKSFGPFPSSQEYATYLLIGTIVLASAALAGRKPLLALPALIPLIGMLMTGSRGPIVALVAGLATLLAVRGRRPRAWLPRLVMAGVLMVAGLYFTLTHIDPSMVSDTYRPHLQHQIDGLTKPGESTATGHAEMKAQGVWAGLKNPVGYGLGSTTIAAGKFGGENFGTEADLSNLFVSLGLVGGVLYLAVMWQTLRRVGLFWHRSRSAVSLAALGILAVTLLQWLNGGLYSIAPLVWVCVGCADRQLAAGGSADRPRPARRPAVPRRVAAFDEEAFDLEGGLRASHGPKMTT